MHWVSFAMGALCGGIGVMLLLAAYAALSSGPGMMDD